MKKLPRKLRDPLIFLGLLIIVPSTIYFISMNFGDQRVHIEKKQWNPSSAADQGIDRNLLKKAEKYIENRLPMARGMIIIRNGKTVHEKYYWKGGPDEKDYLHSLNTVILHALVGIAIDRQMLDGPEQSLGDFFPNHAGENSSLTISSLLKFRAPLLWGDGPGEYWKLFFSKDRVATAFGVLQQPGGELNPAANFGARFLLADLISTVSGMSIFEFAETHLFAPIGITTLAEMKKKDRFMDPFIGFELRTLDLAKFGYMIMNRGVWEGNQVVPEYWAEWITRLTDGQGTWGGWQHEMVGVTPTIIARGEGGQFIVLAPELDMIVAVSSKSRFPLSESSGYSHLFGLIFTASDAKLTRMKQVVDPEDRPFYEPNFIHATMVPDEIKQFFLSFARDIATQDINRILYHYAKGYETKDDNRGFLDKLFLDDGDYRSMYAFWRKIFYGGTGDLEFVHIEKLRIDGNRAYLRGNLKYSYANMNEGSFGWFPLENLVKLRGRWLWLGAPEYGEILDRDEYFDAEVSEEMEKFINNCGQSLVRLPGMSNTVCIAGDFLYNGLQQEYMHELLQPLWDSDSEVKMHITGVVESGDVAQLVGYLDNSLIGAIHLPPGMQVNRHDSGWKWSGNGRQ